MSSISYVRPSNWLNVCIKTDDNFWIVKFYDQYLINETIQENCPPKKKSTKHNGIIRLDINLQKHQNFACKYTKTKWKSFLHCFLWLLLILSTSQFFIIQKDYAFV